MNYCNIVAARLLLSNPFSSEIQVDDHCPGVALTLEESLDKIEQFQSEASAQCAQIVCFPEAYIPGLRGQDLGQLQTATRNHDSATGTCTSMDPSRFWVEGRGWTKTIELQIGDVLRCRQPRQRAGS